MPDMSQGLSSRFDSAFVYASRLHADQFRKNYDPEAPKIPYIAHLMSVAAIVLEHGGSEEEAIAALLHDAVEDRGGQATRNTIAALFGERVAEIVDGCTDAVPEPGQEKGDWGPRKEAYIAHLKSVDASVLLVSAADKLHNARAILSDFRELGDPLWGRFRGGREGTLWYYNALVEAFRQRGKHPRLVHELARTVSELNEIVRGAGA